jgi:hypothetical protein
MEIFHSALFALRRETFHPAEDEEEKIEKREEEKVD